MFYYMHNNNNYVTKDKLCGFRDSDHAIVHLGLNVSSSAHNRVCVVNGGNVMAAI